jgi:hypothetical protein
MILFYLKNEMMVNIIEVGFGEEGKDENSC